MPWERFIALGQADGEQGQLQHDLPGAELRVLRERRQRDARHGLAASSCARSGRACSRARCRSTRSSTACTCRPGRSPRDRALLGVNERGRRAGGLRRARVDELASCLGLRASKRELRRSPDGRDARRGSRAPSSCAATRPALLARAAGRTRTRTRSGSASRAASRRYKRATLLFQDPARLAELLVRSGRGPCASSSPARRTRATASARSSCQAHRRADARRATSRASVFFLEDYDVDLARALVQGVDVWLNTPVRWLEASGTSGMKAAANGTLNLSIGDGWWPEAFDGENGWQLGGSEYKDQALLDQFDGEPPVRHARGGGHACSTSSATRGRRRRAGSSASSAASRSVPHALQHGPDGARVPRQARTRTSASRVRRAPAQQALEARRCSCRRTSGIRKGFGRSRSRPAHVGELASLHVGDPVEVRVEVNLGSLKPDDVRVELVLGHSASELELTGRRGGAARARADDQRQRARLRGREGDGPVGELRVRDPGARPDGSRARGVARGPGAVGVGPVGQPKVSSSREPFPVDGKSK